MAVRNLTSNFLELRKKLRKRSPSFRSPKPGVASEPFLRPGDGAEPLPQIHGPVLPPVWVDTVDEIKDDLDKIRGHLQKLYRFHAERKKISFNDDDVSKDRQIEILTQEITRLFRGCEKNLKKIATIGNEKGTNLPYQERVVRLNVMRSLASSVQTLSKEFRQSQKTFLQGMKKTHQNKFVENLLPEDEDSDTISFGGVVPGLSQDQVEEVKDLYERSNARQQEIIRIAQSINELAEIFRELSVLVIEQGSILDRIDYNVEQALVQVKDGVKDIEKAEDHQKKARTTLCVIFLLIAIIICVVIIIFRQSL